MYAHRRTAPSQKSPRNRRDGSGRDHHHGQGRTDRDCGRSGADARQARADHEFVVAPDRLGHDQRREQHGREQLDDARDRVRELAAA
jgi:hypothetical protein